MQNKELKHKRFEYIDIHYFDVCESLSKDTCALLNGKLTEVKAVYEKILLRL